MARGYSYADDKGAIVDGRRATLLSRCDRYRVGEPVRVIHVFEIVEPGQDVYVMGPKEIRNEWVDGELQPRGPDPCTRLGIAACRPVGRHVMDTPPSPGAPLRPPLRIVAVRTAASFVIAVLAGWASGACREDDSADEQAGHACEVPDDCYPDVEDPGVIQGEITCLDRVPGGYCTHLCETDDDCCAAEGECRSGYPQVCAPFESTGMRMCFLSCEDENLGEYDADGYCHEFANRAFGCSPTCCGSEHRCREAVR